MNRKSFYILICASFIGMSASCGGNKPADNVASQEEISGEMAVAEVAIEEVMDTTEFKNYIVEKVFPIIPDHEIKDEENLKKYTTPELSSAIIEAFNTPEMYPGEIGDEEFLYYFRSGNGDGVSGIAKVKSIIMNGDKAIVMLTENGAPHTLNMVKNSEGKWLMEDFDGKKSEIDAYNKSAREYYSSGKDKNVEYTYPEWIEKVKKYKATYLK